MFLIHAEVSNFEPDIFLLELKIKSMCLIWQTVPHAQFSVFNRCLIRMTQIEVNMLPNMTHQVKMLVLCRFYEHIISSCLRS